MDNSKKAAIVQHMEKLYFLFNRDIKLVNTLRALSPAHVRQIVRDMESKIVEWEDVMTFTDENDKVYKIYETD